MSRFLYNLVRLALFLLALSFLSFYLAAEKGLDMQGLQPFVEGATKYMPVLILPVSIAMVVLLVLRYLGKDRDEKLGFEDFFAGVIALGLQVIVLVLWRAQGNEIAGNLATNIPDIPELTQHADALGTLGLAGLQLVAFLLYVIAGPDKEHA